MHRTPCERDLSRHSLKRHSVGGPDVRPRVPAPLLALFSLLLALLLPLAPLWAQSGGSTVAAGGYALPTVGASGGGPLLLEAAPQHLSVGVATGSDLPAQLSLLTNAGTVGASATRLSRGVRMVSLDGAEPLPGVRPQPPHIPPRRFGQPLGSAGTGSGATGSQQPGGAPSTQAPPPSAPRLSAPLELAGLLQRQGHARTALLAQPDVLWAYPALRNPKTGGLLFLTPRLVLQADAALTPAQVRAALPAEVRVLRALRTQPGQYLLELTDPRADTPTDMAAWLMESLPWVEWAHPDFIQQWRQSALPNDPLVGDQWHVRNTGQGSGLPGADARLANGWETTTGATSVVIAVIDDGVQIAHPDLAANIYVNALELGGDEDGNGYTNDINGWDFCETITGDGGDNDPNPVLTWPSHGTAVAGVVAAVGNNTLGVTGACQTCKILPVRMFCDDGDSTTTALLAEAITYAAKNADVINASWGGGSPVTALTLAIQNAAAPGPTGLDTPLLFSAGNWGSGYVTAAIYGIPAGNWIFEWRFLKDGSGSAGLDTAWLDSVLLPDGTLEGFENCSTLPPGWTTSADAPWSVVADETRAHALLGGGCAMQAAAIGNGQFSSLWVTVTASPNSDLIFSVWPSAQANTSGGVGDIRGDDGYAPAECLDGVQLNVYSGAGVFNGTYYFLCGTYSNQGAPLQDGFLAYPASMAETIAVGAASNFDRRSDYAQWGTGLDFVAHSSGGTLDIVTTDLTGAAGYSNLVGYAGGDYTDTFGGTSSAAPLASGITGLLLAQTPGLTEVQVRAALRAATRKVGVTPYVSGRNDVYGYGVLSAEALLAPGSLPAAPTLNAVTSPTTVATQLLSGGKPAATAVYINGSEVVASDAAITWSHAVTLTVGYNPLSITVRDSVSGLESPSVLAEIEYTVAGWGGGTGTPPVASTAGGGGGGFCLITALTEGWLADTQLDPLRDLRESLWQAGPWGRSLVRLYYRASAWVLAPHPATPGATSLV